MKKSISVIIYTYNDCNNITDCINSAKKLTDNIIVIDMQSTDNTVELARFKGVQVYSFPNQYYVEPAREFGVQKAQTDWVFLLDADERISNELAKEILQNIHEEKYSYYLVPRKNIFGRKKWLKHGGWWPDYIIRICNKNKFISWPKNIHSTPIIKGEHLKLSSPITHYFHGDINQMVKKTIIYEHIESELLFQAHTPVTIAIFFRKYFGELFRRLIKKLGFLDGTIGIIECIYQAFSKTITYLYLYEKKNRRLV